MPVTKPTKVKSLRLDLANFRTVRQNDEVAAIQAIIATSPDRFWALVESLLADGFLPTENILVLQTGPGGKQLTVKEGNRRIAAMKLLHGLIEAKKFEIPSDVATSIKKVGIEWKRANEVVPCAIYGSSESSTVDRIVTLAHGKGERASRDQWNAVARARHNRDANSGIEPALDLLEKYVRLGKNITDSQRARWAGDYPLTVLDEAIKRLAPRLSIANATAVAASYPLIVHRDALESMMVDIGLKELGFEQIRAKTTDFAAAYGIPVQASSRGATSGAKSTSTQSGSGASSSSGTGSGKSTGTSQGSKSGKTKAAALSDPKAVRRRLKSFAPKGKGREKVTTLKVEASKLDLNETPLAFSFVLRSVFEISAKAYCADHANTGGPSTKKSDGNDKALADLLSDVVNHLTKNNQDKTVLKALHGAIAELAKPSGLLSVTSLNQLVHNPRFSIEPGDVAIRFANVFPLLEAMNS